MLKKDLVYKYTVNIFTIFILSIGRLFFYQSCFKISCLTKELFFLSKHLKLIALSAPKSFQQLNGPIFFFLYTFQVEN